MDWKGALSRAKSHLLSKRKWISFLAALVVILIGTWLFFTQTGELAQRSFFKSFGQTEFGPQVIQVYNGGEKIIELVGSFSVEHYQGRIVIIDKHNNEYIDLYGNTSVVVQLSEEEYQRYPTE